MSHASRRPLALAAALLLGGAAAGAPLVAQDDPEAAFAREELRIEQPFATGEVWVARGVLTEERFERQERERSAEGIAWLESSVILARPEGLEGELVMETALTGLRIESIAPNMRSLQQYTDEDLDRILDRQGDEVPFVRSWTYRLAPSWEVTAIEGADDTVGQLFDYALHRAEADGETPWLVRLLPDEWRRGIERGIKRRVARRGGDALARAVRRGVNDVSAPLAAAMERLAIGPVFPDALLPFEARGQLPAGNVRYLGRDEEGQGRFEAVWADGGQDLPAYAFAIDPAGRLVELTIETTERTRERGEEVVIRRGLRWTLQEVLPGPGAVDELRGK